LKCYSSFLTSFSADFDFFIDQLYRLLTKLCEEMLVPF
jgi:hypothetical protein